MSKLETVSKRQPTIMRFVTLEPEYNEVSMLKFLLDTDYIVNIENHEAVEIVSKARDNGIFQNYNGSNALSILLSHAHDLPMRIVVRLFEKLKASGYIVDEIVDALAEVKCPIDRVVLLSDPRVTRKMLDIESTHKKRRTAEKAYKRVMDLQDFDNLEVLLHHGPDRRVLARMFLEKLTSMLLGDKPDLKLAKLFLQMLMTWKLHLVVPMSKFYRVYDEGRHEVMRLLLDCGFDEFVRKTYQHDFLLYLFGNRNVNAIDLLRNKSFDVNALHNGNTALKLAVKRESQEYVRFLLDKGATVNHPPYNDNSLVVALKSRSTAMVSLLLEGGANVKLIDAAKHTTPLHFACSADVVELLLLRGANPEALSVGGRTVFENKQLSVIKPILAHLALVTMRRVLIITTVVVKIKQNTAHRDFWVECLRQNRWMKKQNVSGMTTIFDIICGKVEWVTRWMDVNWIKERVLSCARDGQVDPYYVNLLGCKFENVFLMQKLKREAGRVLSEAIGLFDVNNLVIDKIIDYLTVRDLALFK